MRYEPRDCEGSVNCFWNHDMVVDGGVKMLQLANGGAAGFGWDENQEMNMHVEERGDEDIILTVAIKLYSLERLVTRLHEFETASTAPPFLLRQMSGLYQKPHVMSTVTSPSVATPRYT